MKAMSSVPVPAPPGGPRPGRPSPSAARRAGDRYQDLYGWYRALELLRPARKVWRVCIEDPSAGSFDDVTIRPAPDTSHPAEFVQVKFHVNAAGAYSAQGLIAEPRTGATSLLMKAWRSWWVLRDEGPDVQLHLVTTWSWDHNDPLAIHLLHGTRLAPAFLTGDVTGHAQVERTRWHEHLGRPAQREFQEFLGAMRFRLGYPATSELAQLTSERMESVGWNHDDVAVNLGTEQVWQWIASGKREITQQDMLTAAAANELPAVPVDPALTVYLHTIRRDPPETDADYELDWRSYFIGDEWTRGHGVHDPACWNAAMLPELLQLRDSMTRDSGCRLLRVRGRARLSAWFALGHVFSQAAGWRLEVDQGGSWWRNDQPPSTTLDVTQELELRDLSNDTLAVAVAVGSDLSGDVRAYLDGCGTAVGALLIIRVGVDARSLALRSSADATALASEVRNRIRGALGKRPRRALLFYLGPLAGAAFMGSQLNAVAGEVQIFEDQGQTYAPSFLLR